jgi:hypothetical protein
VCKIFLGPNKIQTNKLVIVMDGPLAQLPLDLLELVLGFIDDGIKPLVRLSSCSRQLQSSVKDVVNSKVVGVKREGFKLNEGETWLDVLRFIELRDGMDHLADFPLEITGIYVVRVSGHQFVHQADFPLEITGIPVVHVARGFKHTVAVTACGKLFTSGWGFYGCLGHGTRADELAPRRVEGPLAEERVVAAAAGANHTVVLTASGAVFTFGFGDLGQLGHGNEQNQLTPRRVEALAECQAARIAVGIAHSTVLTEDQFTPKRVEALADHRVVRIVAGVYHTVVLTAAGVVITFGYNVDRELDRHTGAPPPPNEPSSGQVGALSRAAACALTVPLIRPPAGLSAGVITSSGRLVTFGN